MYLVKMSTSSKYLIKTDLPLNVLLLMVLAAEVYLAKPFIFTLENNGLGPHASQATTINQCNDSYAVYTNGRFLFQAEFELFSAASDTALTSEVFPVTLERFTRQV